MRKLILVIAVCTVVLMSLGPTAMAASYGRLSIIPAIEQLEIKPDQSSISYQIRLDNNQSTPLNLKASSLDFKSLNDTGGLAFIASDANQLEHKYGLANWISLPTDTISLPANGGQFVRVTIDNRADLAPGGHYAAVLFRVITPDGQPGKNSVQTNQIISSLIFIRKSGGAIYSINLNKVTLHRRFGWFGWPTTVDTLFYNSGNVQTAPLGLVSVAGRHSQLNLNSSLVLPASNRLVTTDISNIKPPFWPGFYHIAVNYHPDESGASKSRQVSFLYIGWPFLAVLLAIVAAVFVIFGRLRRSAWWWLRNSTFWLTPRGWRLLKSLKHLYFVSRWLIKKTLMLAWKVLVFLDYSGGVVLLALDKRRAKKNRKK